MEKLRHYTAWKWILLFTGCLMMLSIGYPGYAATGNMWVTANTPGQETFPGPTMNTYVPELKWSSGGNVSYFQVTVYLNYTYRTGVSIQLKEQFRKLHEAKVQGATSYRIPPFILPPGQYYWTVTAYGPAGTKGPTAASKPRYFVTPEIVCVSPGVNDVSNSPTIDTVTPTLRWTAGEGGYYDLQIQKNTDGAWLTTHMSKNISGLSYTVPAGVLERGRAYQWFVSPAYKTLDNANLSWGGLSLTFKFAVLPFQCSLGKNEELFVGYGRSFTVSGGYTPYTVTSDNSRIVAVIKNSAGYQINGVAPGTAKIRVRDNFDKDFTSVVTVKIKPK